MHLAEYEGTPCALKVLRCSVEDEEGCSLAMNEVSVMVRGPSADLATDGALQRALQRALIPPPLHRNRCSRTPTS